MTKIKVRFKTNFGEIEVESDTIQDVLKALNELTPEFVGRVRDVVSPKILASVKTQLEGVIELTTEGPVVTTRKKLSHYEAIGLVLYALEKKASTSAQINQLLKASGIKSMVPARLNEMTKRGYVFKPDPARPEVKLTVQGEKWIEDRVLTRLKDTAN